MNLLRFTVLSLSVIISSCTTRKEIDIKPEASVIKEKYGDKIYFLEVTKKVFNYEPSSPFLNLEDKKLLKRIAEDTAENQDKYRRIEIIGHSDLTGTEDANLDISKKRAITVMEVMREAGVNRQKLRTSWRAGTEPIAKDRKDSALNRRVEIKFFSMKKDH